MRSRRFAPGLVVLALLAAAACSPGGSTASSGSTPSSGSAPSAGSTPTADDGRVRLVAPDGLGGLLDRERARTRAGSSVPPATVPPATAATVPPPPTTTPPVVGGVAHLTTTFVDPTRGTPARGSTPATTSRTISTTIAYPSATAPTASDPNPPAFTGGLPLLVFAHGFAIDAASYAPLLDDLAAGGYVVAAPDFPGTSTAYPGPAIRSDSLEQPADISFVISSVLAMTQQPGPLAGALASTVGVTGQSDGGVTALATGHNTCCADPRVHASVILTGAAFAFDGQWFPPGSPPVMFVHATADEINPYSESVSMFQQAQSPKDLLTIQGGSHLEVYVDPPWEPEVAKAAVAFFDLHLKGDAGASARLDAVGNQPGLFSLQKG